MHGAMRLGAAGSLPYPHVSRYQTPILRAIGYLPFDDDAMAVGRLQAPVQSNGSCVPGRPFAPSHLRTAWPGHRPLGVP
jgi:hypothetical protein